MFSNGDSVLDKKSCRARPEGRKRMAAGPDLQQLYDGGVTGKSITQGDLVWGQSPR